MLSGQNIGRYEIRSKLGEGGMGEVYSAYDTELGRTVAIKLLSSDFNSDPERKARFRQEARVVSALNHPNILTIYEVGENDFGMFLSTEFVEGTTLRQLMRPGNLGLEKILQISEQVANALAAAHEANIVHRDIKPENIMVRPDGIVKVLDFGLAKPNDEILASSGFDSNHTSPGTIMGSSRYMSPEQARGLEVDGRTDIWSLGVVVYEMLYGVVPFNGETATDTLAAVIYHQPTFSAPNPAAYSSELTDIIQKTLQKDRNARHHNVQELAHDIRTLLHELQHSTNSGQNATIVSSPSFDENPTIIHQTVSGNHPTGSAKSPHTYSRHTSLSNTKARSWLRSAAFLAALLLAAFAGIAAYHWGTSERPLSTYAFLKPQVSRINTDGRVMLPTISPDGKYVAYITGEFGNKSIVVRQIATDSIVTVVNPTNLNLRSISFSPTGDHVYYCQSSIDFAVNTLYKVPVLGGKSEKLIEDVDSSVTFSPEGTEFAFVRHRPDTNEDQILIANASTLEIKPLVSSKEKGYSFFSPHVAWSPDGKVILTGGGKREGGFVTGTEVLEIGISESKIRPIGTIDFFSVTNLVWLADGSGYLFSGQEDTNSPNQIWRSSYPDGNTEQITNDLNDYVTVSISADGRNLVTLKGDTISSVWKFSPRSKTSVQLSPESKNLDGLFGLLHSKTGKLFYSHSEGKDADLWMSDDDGKNSAPLLSGDGFPLDPILSPDGKSVIFNLQKDKTSRIWRMDLDNKDMVALAPENADVIDLHPQTTLDGRFAIFQRKFLSNGRSALMKVPIDHGEPEIFFEMDNTDISQPRISPDGKRIAFIAYNTRSFQQKLMIASLDGDKFGKVENELEFNLINRFVWTPDGRSLSIVTNRSGAQNIWIQPLDGSEASQITDFLAGRILNFTWMADGKNLLIARGNTNTDLILLRDGQRDTPPRSTANKKRRQDIFSTLFG